MRKTFFLIGVITLLYLGSVLVRAYQQESETENYFKQALVDIAQPWSTERLEERASWWLLEKSKLRPSEIVDLAQKDFGNLIEISGEPECNIQQGFDGYSTVKHTYAVCVARLKMEKRKIDMEIRLIQEGRDWKINDFISIK